MTEIYSFLALLASCSFNNWLEYTRYSDPPTGKFLPIFSLNFGSPFTKNKILTKSAKNG